MANKITSNIQSSTPLYPALMRDTSPLSRRIEILKITKANGFYALASVALVTVVILYIARHFFLKNTNSDDPKIGKPGSSKNSFSTISGTPTSLPAALQSTDPAVCEQKKGSDLSAGDSASPALPLNSGNEPMLPSEPIQAIDPAVCEQKKGSDLSAGDSAPPALPLNSGNEPTLPSEPIQAIDTAVCEQKKGSDLSAGDSAPPALPLNSGNEPTLPSEPIQAISGAPSVTETAEAVFEKIKLQDQGVVRDWIIAHHRNYVAHAVFTATNVTSIIKSGFLASAEDLLRTQGIAEYEQAMFGDRVVEHLPKLTESEIAEIRAIEDQFPKWCSLPFGANIDKENYDTENDFLSHIPEDLPANEKAPYTAVRVRAGGPLGRYSKKCDELAKRHQCIPVAVTIAYDQSKAPGQRIDVLLAQVYQTFTEDMKRAKYIKKQVLAAFCQARQRIIFPTKLNHDIRTHKNGIAWSYGKVVILCGKAKEIIGMNMGERCLLAPWQNQGNFLRIQLADHNNLLIGPKSMLEPYEKELREKDVPFQYLESLTFEEAQYFRVPKQ